MKWSKPIHLSYKIHKFLLFLFEKQRLLTPLHVSNTLLVMCIGHYLLGQKKMFLALLPMIFFMPDSKGHSDLQLRLQWNEFYFNIICQLTKFSLMGRLQQIQSLENLDNHDRSLVRNVTFKNLPSRDKRFSFNYLKPKIQFRFQKVHATQVMNYKCIHFNFYLC